MMMPAATSSRCRSKSVAETKKSEPGERTDDPVRMYLREMGSVELLSREGEIAIAKRIEAGREAMIAGLVRKPAHLPGDHHLARRAERRKGVPARHHRPRSDLCGPRRREGHGEPGRARSAGRPRRDAGRWPLPAPPCWAGARAGRGAAVGAAGRDPVPPRRLPPADAARRPPMARPTAGRGRRGGRAGRRGRPRRRRHGEFALARRDRGRAEAEGDGGLRQDRQRVQAAAPPAGPGHREPAAERVALARAGAQVQEDQGRPRRRGEVAAAQPGAHRRAGRAALRHQQAAHLVSKAA